MKPLLVTKIVETLQKALQAKLGDQAPIYAYVNNELCHVDVQVNPKGKLGHGSVLLLVKKL